MTNVEVTIGSQGKFTAMAELVAAFGTSHSPALNSPPEDVVSHVLQDKKRSLLDKDGNKASYDELLERADPNLEAQVTPEVIAKRVADCDQMIDRLAQAISAASLDALIVVGDDQREQYFNDNQPAFLVYWGKTITNTVTDLPDEAPAFWKHARSQYHEESGPRKYPVSSKLGRHVIEHLMDAEFDVSHGTSLPKPRGEGHAFGFVHRRLMDPNAEPIPILPIAVNTYFPPNQPRPRRCYRLGQELAAAVASFPGDERIGIIASGGLSHFTVDEDLDQTVLRGCRDGDGDALGMIPVNQLNSGNSEIRNWIVTAGAAEGLASKWDSYVPFYRSPAGTGCGMAFAEWGR